jgi:hypothetical protein
MQSSSIGVQSGFLGTIPPPPGNSVLGTETLIDDTARVPNIPRQYQTFTSDYNSADGGAATSKPTGERGHPNAKNGKFADSDDSPQSFRRYRAIRERRPAFFRAGPSAPRRATQLATGQPTGTLLFPGRDSRRFPSLDHRRSSYKNAHSRPNVKPDPDLKARIARDRAARRVAGKFNPPRG